MPSNDPNQLITNATDNILNTDHGWFVTTLTPLTFPVRMYTATKSSSNATIHFRGSYITVFGAVPSDSAEYRSWYTLDDDQPVLFKTTVTGQTKNELNSVFFQPASNLPDGNHTLVITNEAGLLLLDYFSIVPSIDPPCGQAPNTTLSSKPFVKLDDSDLTAITYKNAGQIIGAQGASYLGTLHNLTSSGSSASLDFNGTSVAVYGSLERSDSQQLPSITIIMDNSTYAIPPSNPQPFDPEAGILASPGFPPLSTDNGTVHQVLLWQSTPLGYGLHTLKILVNNGTLLLDFFLVKTSSGYESAKCTLASPIGPASPNVTVIATGVLGPITFILLLALVYILLRRRTFSSMRRQIRCDSGSTLHPSPESTSAAGITPFTAGMNGERQRHCVEGGGRRVKLLVGHQNSLSESTGHNPESLPPPYPSRPSEDQDLCDMGNGVDHGVDHGEVGQARERMRSEASQQVTYHEHDGSGRPLTDAHESHLPSYHSIDGQSAEPPAALSAVVSD